MCIRLCSLNFPHGPTSDVCDHSQSVRHAERLPEVLCAVLVREPLWPEARMDDQALLEGIVVFSDEDGPGGRRQAVRHQHTVSCCFVSRAIMYCGTYVHSKRVHSNIVFTWS